jgi:hypothetical protein
MDAAIEATRNGVSHGCYTYTTDYTLYYYTTILLHYSRHPLPSQVRLIYYYTSIPLYYIDTSSPHRYVDTFHALHNEHNRAKLGLKAVLVLL